MYLCVCVGVRERARVSLTGPVSVDRSLPSAKCQPPAVWHPVHKPQKCRRPFCWAGAPLPIPCPLRPPHGPHIAQAQHEFADIAEADLMLRREEITECRNGQASLVRDLDRGSAEWTERLSDKVCPRHGVRP